jgi:hypothetical protein
MRIVDATKKIAAARARYFIRFGDLPEGNKSRMWTAPNIYMHGRIGQTLPGLSAYSANRKGKKWVLMTDDINVGSGIASLFDCFHRVLQAPDINKIYLLKGIVTTWKNLSLQEQKKFADWYPGKGREGFDILGTDGEPLVRDFEIVSPVRVTDLVCKMIGFPEEWEADLDEVDGPKASSALE